MIYGLSTNLDRRKNLIHIGRIGAPELRLGDDELLIKFLHRTTENTLGGIRIRHRLTRRIHNHGAEHDIRCFTRLILHFGAKSNGGFFLGNLRRRDIGAPVGDMDLVHFHEPDMAIDSGTRIPATATRLDIGTDGNVVWLAAVFQIGREVVAQTHISIRAMPEKVPIDPDLAVHIHAVKIDGDFFAFVRFRQSEGFAIPPDATRQIPDSATPGILGS